MKEIIIKIGDCQQNYESSYTELCHCCTESAQTAKDREQLKKA